MTVFISMFFTRGPNAIIIGLFVYLVMQAKDLTKPSDEAIYSMVSKLDTADKGPNGAKPGEGGQLSKNKESRSFEESSK